MKNYGPVLVTAVVVTLFGWVVAPYLKGKAPNTLGYNSLGWARGGVGTNFGVSTPRWHGWAGVRAAIGAPFNHKKVWLDAGQTLEIDYELDAERGGMSLSVYRTRLSVVLQGSMVEDHELIFWERGGYYSGLATYTAANSGWHKISYDILWEPDSHEAVQANPYTVLVPNYDLRYDIRWRLRDKDYIDFGSIKSQRLPHGS